MLEIASRLGVTVDELIRGPRPSYVVSRPRAEGLLSAVLLDDSTLGVNAVLVRVPPGGSASPGMAHDVPVAVLVGSGMVQVVLEENRPVLREGEALTVASGGIRSCRNLSDREALLFWLTPHAATR
ncbi:hypothetical protein NKH77_51510 [Streptomyces sp. M19]